MEPKFVLHVLVLCFVFSVLAQGKRGKKLEETLSFDVKPSGQVAHQSIKLENGVTCVFTYAAVGGTNEEWTMTLRRTKKTYTCTIERYPSKESSTSLAQIRAGLEKLTPQNLLEVTMPLLFSGLCLFRFSFKSGPWLNNWISVQPDQTSYLYFMNFAASVLEHTVETAEVFDNTGALLQDEEFILTDNDRSVKHKDGGFQSNLSKIILTVHAKQS